MRDPIERLLQEHKVIMRQVAELRGAVKALAERGDAALPEMRPALQGTVRMIETELLAHARREDDAFFPAVERALDVAEMTGQMRQEHRDIHAEADRFRATLRELNEVEHPAIVAGQAKLDALAATGGAKALRESAAELIRMLDEHFQKEEEVLFPMARGVMEDAELEKVAREMESLDVG